MHLYVCLRVFQDLQPETVIAVAYIKASVPFDAGYDIDGTWVGHDPLDDGSDEVGLGHGGVDVQDGGEDEHG